MHLRSVATSVRIIPRISLRYGTEIAVFLLGSLFAMPPAMAGAIALRQFFRG